MTGRQVLVERDDLERLIELALDGSPLSMPPGWVAFGPDGEGPADEIGGPGLDFSDWVLVERVRREALGR